jgi:hypothetical protein
LNPAERVFEELRREVEGQVYGTIEKKIAAVEQALKDLTASPERVQGLTGWSWIRASPSPTSSGICSLLIANQYCYPVGDSGFVFAMRQPVVYYECLGAFNYFATTGMTR